MCVWKVLAACLAGFIIHVQRFASLEYNMSFASLSRPGERRRRRPRPTASKALRTGGVRGRKAPPGGGGGRRDHRGAASREPVAQPALDRHARADDGDENVRTA